MKFTVLHEFQHAGINFEVGNTHAKHGLSDQIVLGFHAQGWVDVESLPTNDLKVGDVEITPDDIILNFDAGVN
jgi:hypothetical protein